MPRKKPAAARKTAGNAETDNKRKKRLKLHEYSVHNDMKYRGPISYQGFQIMGWACIVLTVLLMILSFNARVKTDTADQTATARTVLGFFSDLTLPFLLIANFSQILNSKEGYRKHLLKNGGAAFGIAAVSVLFFLRYVVGGAQQVVTDPQQVLPLMREFFSTYNKNGFIAFNIFVDLFLCTLTMYCLNARPKRFFTGKKILILRFSVLLPVAYEVLSLYLKFRASGGRLALPFWSFPLLTVKPPMTFALFLFLALFFRSRERRFCRHGRSHGEYLEFLGTNRNSFQVSLYLSIMIIVMAVIDFILMSLAIAFQAGAPEVLEDQEFLTGAVSSSLAIGLGGSVSMVFAVPFLLLYSYNRKPRRIRISMIIPAVAVVLIILILLEGVRYDLSLFTEGSKIDIQQIMQSMQEGAAGLQ